MVLSLSTAKEVSSSLSLLLSLNSLIPFSRYYSLISHPQDLIFLQNHKVWSTFKCAIQNSVGVGQHHFLEVFSNLNKNSWCGLVCYDAFPFFSSICNDCNCKAFVICKPHGMRAILFAISEPQTVHFYSRALFLVYLAHPWLTCGHATTCFSD